MKALEEGIKRSGVEVEPLPGATDSAVDTLPTS